VISLSLATLLTVAGLYILWFEAFDASVIHSRMLMAGGFIVTLGVGWLWSDLKREKSSP
jgi:hypothetical protein